MRRAAIGPLINLEFIKPSGNIKHISKFLATMDHHPQQVIELNNRGALHIEAGNFDEAVLELTEALHQFKLIKRPSRLSTNMDHNNSTKESHLSLILEDVKALILNTDGEDSEEFVYRHPIRIERNPHETPELGTTTSTFLSFAVIFNLAISYHMQSCGREEQQHQHTEKRKFLLEKSKHLYELGYRLLRSEDVSFSVRISLVLTNNLGQVLKNLQEHQQADLCFERLLSTVMFLMDCGADDELYEIDGFIRNTSHLVLKNPAASAA
jgi:tetratricopeptide (TPR) repeat protein